MDTIVPTRFKPIMGFQLPTSFKLLLQAYGIEGRLHVSYALTPAWG